jgi:hypothetical protein
VASFRTDTFSTYRSNNNISVFNKVARHEVVWWTGVTPAHILNFGTRLKWSRSSGSIVSDYGLDDRVVGVQSPAGAKDFSPILCVQTGSGAHPDSCQMGTGGPFPGSKARPGRDADHSPPSSAEVVNE